MRSCRERQQTAPFARQCGSRSMAWPSMDGTDAVTVVHRLRVAAGTRDGIGAAQGCVAMPVSAPSESTWRKTPTGRRLGVDARSVCLGRSVHDDTMAG